MENAIEERNIFTTWNRKTMNTSLGSFYNNADSPVAPQTIWGNI